MIGRPARTRAGVVSLTGLVVLAGAAAGCGLGSDDPRPDAPVGVGLDSLSAPADVDLGVVVSVTSTPGQGSEWVAAAQGAQVAAFRLADSGTRVRLHTVNDSGTAEGGAAAVRQLVADHDVAGIVLATSGSHTSAALAEAGRAGVPVVAPYEPAPEAGGSDTWLTGPSQEAIDTSLAEVLRERQLSRVGLVDVGGRVPSGISPVERLVLDPTRPGRTARQAARLAADGAVDALVVAGPAQAQAQVVRLLQGARLQLPVVLTADALSPVFAETLLQQDGTLEGDLVSAGIDADDPGALRAGQQGSAVSAWLAALRAASADPEVEGLVDEQPFAEVAGAADTRSHDSVIALVAATAVARSTDPAHVADALATLRLDASDGLAGPALDLTEADAVPVESVVPLQATTQDPGLRSGGAEVAKLFWFALPSA